MVKATAHIVLFLLLTATLSACEPQARHRMLTFFFTGVPPLEETDSAETISDQPLPPAAIRATVSDSTDKLFSHPVWQAGVCDPCHQTTGAFSAPGVGKRLAVFKQGGGRPADLTLAKNKICTQCHSDKTPQRALSENLWLHNTTAKGDCLVCHDPHQSNNPKTLRLPSGALCVSPCHEQGKFMVTPSHQTEQECLSCHNPHMGINENLLTKEYKELKIAVAAVPGHPELGRE
ncbi:MAG: putative CXXCH cytochrome family protein [Desulforhopalus sp.]|jgi:predicted CXXCH cytochrome family protein